MRARGFTLVELLVALAIFGVVSVISLHALSAALQQRAHVEGESRKWRELGRLLGVIEADLAAALGEGAWFEGPSQAAGEGWLRFARAGHAQAGEQPLAPSTVVYRLVGGHVERSTHASLYGDFGAPALAAQRYPAVIAAVSLRFLSSRGDWLPHWDPAQAQLPRAVELAVELASRERVRRVILVR